MKFNMQKWAENIIASKDVKNLPVLYFPVLKNIEMSVPDSVNDPKKIAKAMKEVIDEYPETIAAITGMDLTVDTEAFGGKVNYSEFIAATLNSIKFEKDAKLSSIFQYFDPNNTGFITAQSVINALKEMALYKDFMFMLGEPSFIFLAVMLSIESK